MKKTGNLDLITGEDGTNYFLGHGEVIDDVHCVEWRGDSGDKVLRPTTEVITELATKNSISSGEINVVSCYGGALKEGTQINGLRITPMMKTVENWVISHSGDGSSGSLALNSESQVKLPA